MRGAALMAMVGTLASLAAIGAASAQNANAFTPDPQPNATQNDGSGLVSGANSFGEDQARAAIAAKGFTDVSHLVNDSHGIWRGTALKNGAPVKVSIDFKGNVHAE